MIPDRQLTDFFADYVAAFAAEDADALSAMWDEVGLFPSPTGNFCMDRAAFRDHCVTLFGFYRAQGVVKPEGMLLSVEMLFPDVAQARMAYVMHGANGLVAAWEHVYILRRTEAWRISLTIADGELAAWLAKGATL